MPLDNMMWYAKIGVFQLTKFKSTPIYDLELMLNIPISSLGSFFFTFCNFFINLGLSIYHILPLLTCFSVAKPSWITSPKLITIFLLFIYISHSAQVREGLIKLLTVYSNDIEVNPGPKIKSQLSLFHWNLNSLGAPNLLKVSILHTLAATHDYDII